MDVWQEAEELVVNIAQFEPVMPGALIIKSNLGYAIVHDLEQQPSGNPINGIVSPLLDYGSWPRRVLSIVFGLSTVSWSSRPGPSFQLVRFL